MKSLSAYAFEKLIVNKNYKDPSATSNIEDFNDIKEIYAIGYNHGNQYFFIAKYNVSKINRYDHPKQSFYEIDAKSKLYSMSSMYATWIETTKVLYAVTGNSNYIFIHPEDISRLNELYLFAKQLKPNDKYSLEEILDRKLNIGIGFLRDDPYVKLECNMAPETIADLMKDIEKTLQNS